ncbi:hypothetical protein EDB80DRAFT_591846 [Ilyonectria destructans]|nr:hypothetical protein EDB80DRAFT_591846 [Ilyonectria destructans]
MHRPDVQMLAQQGCFTIPDQQALGQFFRQYFLHIHPLLPIIDEARFWEMHQQVTTVENILSGQFSLLLLYGILYVSSSYMSTDLIERLGFRTLHQTQTVYYMRAKLLHDSRFEQSPISIAQTALLLSHCYFIQPAQSLNNRAPMWLSIAIYHAKEAKAHLYNSIPLPATTGSARLRQTLKRLWWCCIIRDRIMPLASRQDIQISHSNFDFNSQPPLGASDLAEEIQHSTTYTSDVKSSLVEILVELAKLCVILTDVLSINSSPVKRDACTQMQQAEQANRTHNCQSLLKQWYSFMPRYQQKVQRKRHLNPGLTESRESFITLFTNIVIMYYHSANLALCHQEILLFGDCSSSAGPASGDIGSHSDRQQVQLAISQLVQCLTQLVELRLARWIPLSSIGCVMFPLALQILDLQLLSATNGTQSDPHPDPAILKLRQKRFSGLIEAMQACRPRFVVIDWALHCIRVSVTSFHRLLLEPLHSLDTTLTFCCHQGVGQTFSVSSPTCTCPWPL